MEAIHFEIPAKYSPEPSVLVYDLQPNLPTPRNEPVIQIGFPMNARRQQTLFDELLGKAATKTFLYLDPVKASNDRLYSTRRDAAWERLAIGGVKMVSNGVQST